MIYLFKLSWLDSEIYASLDEWIEQNKDIAHIQYIEWEAPGMRGWIRKERAALCVYGDEAAMYCKLKFNLELVDSKIHKK